MSAHDTILSQIRALASSGAVRITQHAQQEMVAESIPLDDVLHAIASARIIEDYPDHRRGACCLLHGVDGNRRDIHVVCTTANPTLTIAGCPGEYEVKEIMHTVRHAGRVIVIDHVPAEVCSDCGDVLLEPQTVRDIEHLLANLPKPRRTAPLYEYASSTRE
jgi:YgiT-type zinc finger domain-containing protein